MNRDTKFYNLSIKNILSKEQSSLDKARIRLLYYGFWIVLVAVVGLFTSVYFQRHSGASMQSRLKSGRRPRFFRQRQISGP